VGFVTDSLASVLATRAALDLSGLACPATCQPADHQDETMEARFAILPFVPKPAPTRKAGPNPSPSEAAAPIVENTIVIKTTPRQARCIQSIVEAIGGQEAVWRLIGEQPTFWPSTIVGSIVEIPSGRRLTRTIARRIDHGNEDRR
jgi:hypothetical protein